MEFEEQVTNVEIIVDNTPRVYLKWLNTEEGRDKGDCFERTVIGDAIIYTNTFNRNLSVTNGHLFFDKLERMYNNALKS